MHSTYDFGNFRKRSATLSTGAVINPIAISKGGYSPALGWLRVGTKALVLLKLLAMDSDSPAEDWRADSMAGRSLVSSSLMCSDK
jgi:hypothetical protein